MKSNNILLLNKNKKVDKIKERDFKYDEDVKYILIPIESYDIDAYIMIRPSKLLDFDYCIINTALSYVNLDLSSVFNPNHIYLEDLNRMSSVNEMRELDEIKVTSVVELINFLHSIDKMSYINETILNNEKYFTRETIELLGIPYLNIRMYKKDNLIYESSIQYDKVYTNHMNAVEDNLNYYKKEIKAIYDVPNYRKLFSNVNKYGEGEYDKFLYISNNRWDIGKINKNSAIGFPMPNSRSIVFLKYNTIQMFDPLTYYHLGLFYTDLGSISKKKTTIEEKVDNAFIDSHIMYNYMNEMIETIIYCKYLKVQLTTLYNIFIYNVDQYSKKSDITEDFHIDVNIKFEITTDRKKEASFFMDFEEMEKLKLYPLQYFLYKISTIKENDKK